MTMFTKLWWKKALERVVRSLAQAVILALGTDAAGLLDLDWGDALVLVIGYPLLSFAHFIVWTPEEAKP